MGVTDDLVVDILLPSGLTKDTRRTQAGKAKTTSALLNWIVVIIQVYRTSKTYSAGNSEAAYGYTAKTKALRWFQTER
mgnify:FL=1|tara:strand:+ start:5982 stop:6215 length:234 start_codon:yes stop_codon:yes gene_type:complete